MLAETCNRGPRLNSAIAAAGHEQRARGAKGYRRRRSAGVAQILAAARRTLRPGRNVVPCDGRAQQVEADDVIAQVRAKIGRDRFGDLDGCKLDSALSEHVPGERRSGDAARMLAVEKGLDLPV